MSVVSETVKRIVVDLLGLKESDYNPKLTFDELGARTIDFDELIIFCEYEFGNWISDEEAKKLTTPAKLIKWLEQKNEQ